MADTAAATGTAPRPGAAPSIRSTPGPEAPPAPGAAIGMAPSQDLAAKRANAERAMRDLAESEDARCREIRASVEALIAAEGFTMDRIFPELAKGGGGRARRARPAGGARTIAHRNPANEEETWSGGGPAPAWVRTICTERGIEVREFRKLEEFLVKAS